MYVAFSCETKVTHAALDILMAVWSQADLNLYSGPPKDRSPGHQPTLTPLSTASLPENMIKSSQLKGCCEDHLGLGKR